jgi:NTE family protein
MFKNKKVAFIASGGGARGVAHGGVLKACEEAKIKFDLLIGASAGAICVAYYSQTPDADRLIDMFKPKRKRKYNKTFGWRKMIGIKNFFSSRIKTGIVDTASAEKFFRESLDTDDFNKLKIPTYISATNLSTGNGELFGTGIEPSVPISKAIVASCCVPIIFRPVKINESFYIDGEIKRPTAVNTAFELGADIAIVSDIYQPHTDGIEKSNMFNIASQMVSMLLEDKSMRGIKIAKGKFPDKKVILISPNVGDISAIHTFSYKKLEKLGYQAAKRELESVT